MNRVATGRRERVLGNLGLVPTAPSLGIRRLPLVLASVWSASAALAARLTGRGVADFTREPVAALRDTTCAGADCAYIGALSKRAC